VVEAFTPTFGIFTALGAVALVVGALSLPVEPMLPEEWYRDFIVTVLGMVAVTIAFFTLVIMKVISASRKSRVHEHFGMKGFSGLATEDLDPEGRIRIRGEWWKARSAGGGRIPKESSVTVKDQDGMVLIVEKNSDE
jgi:membrane-bound serine protease (ClpP class)